MTGWIQIENIEKHHEGDYTCVAQNKHNKDFAKARVKVLYVEEVSEHVTICFSNQCDDDDDDDVCVCVCVCVCVYTRKRKSRSCQY